MRMRYASRLPSNAERYVRALADELRAARRSLDSTTPESIRRELAKVTLYSFRHVFAASAKASGVKPAGLAAMMGHASIETAYCHYGKMRYGWLKVAAAPSLQSLAAVLSRARQRTARATRKAGKDPCEPNF